MFGFENISNYTHKMENMYDLVRQKKLKVTREMLDVTFESADHITSMLNDDGSKAAEIAANEVILNKRIDAILNGESEPEVITAQPAASEKSDGVETFYVKIKPYERIQQNGTNPFFLIDELSGLGQNKVNIFYANIPDFENFVFDETYIYWEMILATDKGEDAIRDVFIFVEDDCEVTIEKIAEADIFPMEGIEPLLTCRHDFPFDLEKIKSLAGAITALEKAKQEKAAKEADAGDEHIKKFTKESSISGIRVASEKIDLLMNLVSELITTQAGLNLYADNHKNNELTRITESLENISRQLRDTAFSITLIPIDYLVVRFRRLVRDLSREVGKEIEFDARGAETELDKTLIEGISEPLMHILRNSIDHGIETAEERTAKGKPAQGKIILQAYYSGSQVVIAVTDDGKGMDMAKIRAKAIERGLINGDEQLSDT